MAPMLGAHSVLQPTPASGRAWTRTLVFSPGAKKSWDGTPARTQQQLLANVWFWMANG